MSEAAERCGGQLWYYRTDVTKDEEVIDIFASLSQPLRYPIRGLVTCAGVSLNGPSVEFPVASFRRLMDINAAGTFSVAQAVAREMQRTNVSGSMVFVASMSGHGSNKVISSQPSLIEAHD